MFPQTDQVELPAPATAALEHSERLRDRILDAIDAGGGAIAFSRYVGMALYEPGMGYYSAGSVKFGAGGDFITAADLGDYLARAIVTTLAPRLRQLPRPVVVELGAGSGALSAAILQQLDAAGLEHVGYRILEPSPDLQARQRERLAAAGTRVEWLSALAPASITGSVIANEVADALPFERVAFGTGGWQLLGVAREGRALRWQPLPLPKTLAPMLQIAFAETPDGPAHGYVTEVRPLLAPWIAAIGAALSRGDVLIVDYGLSRREYYHPQRNQGTLMCHYRHRAHGDPLLWPGLQDITAWVDFSDCAAAAHKAGLHVTGYSTQGSWIAETVLSGAAAIAAPEPRAAAQLKTLLLPGEMGERFKVLQLSSDVPDAPKLGGRDMQRWL